MVKQVFAALGQQSAFPDYTRCPDFRMSRVSQGFTVGEGGGERKGGCSTVNTTVCSPGASSQQIQLPLDYNS